MVSFPAWVRRAGLQNALVAELAGPPETRALLPGSCLLQTQSSSDRPRSSQQHQYGEAALAQQAQSVQAAQFEQWKDVQDAEAQRLIPELNDPKAASELRGATYQMLKEAGITKETLMRDPQLSRVLHSARGQQVLADAARYRMGQQRLAEATRAPAPQYQRPGVARPSGAAANEQLPALERRLAGSKGNESLRNAVKYHQALRAAGRTRSY